MSKLFEENTKLHETETKNCSNFPEAVIFLKWWKKHFLNLEGYKYNIFTYLF